MDYLIAFAVGGGICALSQLALDALRLTPGQILVALVVIGAILAGFGIYQDFADWAGAGALIPVSGFGSSIVRGILEDTQKLGWEGLFTGAFKATSLGLAAAVVFGAISAVFIKPRH